MEFGFVDRLFLGGRCMWMIDYYCIERKGRKTCIEGVKCINQYKVTLICSGLIARFV